MKSVKQMYKEVGKFFGPGIKYSVELDYASWWGGKGTYRIYATPETGSSWYLSVNGSSFEECFLKAKEKLNELRHSERS